MAAAVTLSGDWLHSIGDLRLVTGTVAFDSSYPTGGESITAAKFGLGKIDFLIATALSGYVFFWDGTNSKLMAYYADNNAAGDSALIQVPDTTDLSALTAIPVLAIGR
jgi:hypothetical protein